MQRIVFFFSDVAPDVHPLRLHGLVGVRPALVLEKHEGRLHEDRRE